MGSRASLPAITKRKKPPFQRLNTTRRASLQSDIKKKRSHSVLQQNLVHHELEKDINDFYEINEGIILGKGMSGNIRLCKDKKSGSLYALKMISKENIDEGNLPRLRSEIHIMTMLDHPNILQVVEVFETEPCIYMILEYCSGQDVLSVLKVQSFGEKRTCQLVSMMLSALGYCHRRGVIHRDIKLENFVFVNKDADSLIKMIDFGLSVDSPSLQNTPSGPLVGTFYYMAPEVLESDYTEKCDIWSVGVATYILICGNPPFDGDSPLDVSRAIRTTRPDFTRPAFGQYSKEAVQFIRKCLNPNVSERPSAEDALLHPWFRMTHTDAPRSEASSPVLQSLQKFAARTQLARVCLEVVAHVLTNDQIVSLREEFRKYDVGNRGEIQFVDLQTALQAAGVCEEEVDLIRIALGADTTDTVQYRKFIAATIVVAGLSDVNLKKAFEKLSQRSDVIAVSNLVELLGAGSSEPEVLAMLKEAGVASADNMSFDDFKKIIFGSFLQHHHRPSHLPRSADDDAIDSEKTMPAPAGLLVDEWERSPPAHSYSRPNSPPRSSKVWTTTTPRVHPALLPDDHE